jgi:hypothetical protein
VSSVSFTDEAEFVNSRFEDEWHLAYLLEDDRQLDAAAEQCLFLIRFKPDDQLNATPFRSRRHN